MPSGREGLGTRFPILLNPELSVPWEAIASHERQADINHGQTLKRLAERGGLDPAEFWFVMNDQRWDEATFRWANDQGLKLIDKLNGATPKREE